MMDFLLGVYSKHSMAADKMSSSCEYVLLHIALPLRHNGRDADISSYLPISDIAEEFEATEPLPVFSNISYSAEVHALQRA
jgi:hypothetical protein